MMSAFHLPVYFDSLYSKQYQPDQTSHSACLSGVHLNMCRRYNNQNRQDNGLEGLFNQLKSGINKVFSVSGECFRTFGSSVDFFPLIWNIYF